MLWPTRTRYTEVKEGRRAAPWQTIEKLLASIVMKYNNCLFALMRSLTAQAVKNLKEKTKQQLKITRKKQPNTA